MPNDRPQISRESSPDQKDAVSYAKLYTASVVSVDPTTYQMRVFAKGTSEPIEIPSPFFNIRDGSGAGFHIIPEIGSEVWILEASDGKKVPLMYHGEIGDSYRNNRPDGIEGDISISTRDGNSIAVHRGGSVSLAAGAVCKMLLEPVTDTITTFSSQSKSYTLSCVTENIVNDRSAISKRKFYKNADDTKPVVEERIGDISGDIRYKFSSKDTQDSDNSFTSEIKNTGDVKVTANVADIHASLVNVGDGDKDSLVKSTEFLQDLSSILTELQKMVGSVEPLIATALATQGIYPGTLLYKAAVPSVTPISTMLSKITSQAYPSTKLKTE